MDLNQFDYLLNELLKTKYNVYADCITFYSQREPMIFSFRYMGYFVKKDITEHFAIEPLPMQKIGCYRDFSETEIMDCLALNISLHQQMIALLKIIDTEIDLVISAIEKNYQVITGYRFDRELSKEAIRKIIK